MASSEKTSNLEIETLLGGNAGRLTQAVAENPMLLDRLVSVLTDIRTAATEKAKLRFRLTRSFWPNFETERATGVYVSWIARDTKNNRDIEVIYDFSKREYSVRDKGEQFEPGEIEQALAMIYVLLPANELKMISIMKERYEAMTTIQGVKRASGRRR
jgi:hypothetical protein